MRRSPAAAFVILPLLFVACVPPGNSTPDSGPPKATAAPPPPPPNMLTSVFEDNFDREMVAVTQLPPTVAAADDAAAALLAPPDAHAAGDAATIARLAQGDAALDALLGPTPPMVVHKDTGAPAMSLGPSWTQARTTAWRIEKGRLCGENAKNHGVWLDKTLPVNARIEFDAISDSPDGDVKAEFWGDGQSAATTVSYTNATSYLTILGGWKNSTHVLARMNEHAPDRKEIKVDKESDDPRQKPVNRGQIYHFKVERTDGKTVKWSVDGIEYLVWADKEPLVGAGHDHFGFNDWEVKVCFDNVKVTPLP